MFSIKQLKNQKIIFILLSFDLIIILYFNYGVPREILQLNFEY